MTKLRLNLNVSPRLSLICLLIIGLFFIISTGLAAKHRSLWYDELFTYHISQLQDPIQVTNALLEGVDITPPTDFLLRHLSTKLLGPSAFGLRAPSIILFLLSSWLIFKFVLYRTSYLSAIVAFCFPILTFALQYSYEGRTYALLLVMSSLSLYAWQQSTNRERNFAYLGLLYFALTVGCFSHLYGVFNYIPIAVGELVRVIKSRKIDYKLILTIVLSVVSLVFLYPFIVNAANPKNTQHFWASIHIFDFITILYKLIPNIGLTVIIILITVVTSTYFFQSNDLKKQDAKCTPIPLHELAAVVVLTLTPFFVYFAAILVTKAITERYVIVAVNGIAILVAYACFGLKQRNRILELCFVGCIVISVFMQLGIITVRHRNEPIHVSESLVDFIDKADLPVVVSSGIEYVRLDYYLGDKTRNKIIYLLDPLKSVEYDGTDSIDIMLPKLNKIRTLNLIPFNSFKQDNGEFYIIIYGSGFGWLKHKVIRDFKENKIKLEYRLITPNETVLKVSKI